jgi:hypothetical protein
MLESIRVGIWNLKSLLLQKAFHIIGFDSIVPFDQHSQLVLWSQMHQIVHVIA